MMNLSQHVYDALWASLSAPGCFMLRIDGDVRWLLTAERKRFSRVLGGSEKLGCRASIAPVPRFGFERTQVADSAVLWVRTEKGEEADALLSWSAKPTFIFRDGDTVRHTALWALTGELDPRMTSRLNKRLAHAIGTAKKYADPSTFEFTPPGSKDPVGKVSQLVHMATADDGFYSARQLVGHLPDAPNPRLAYRRRQEALAA